ncbi:MAG: hypothetical protein U0638_17705 [Phycisphaerales bacterium]
MRKAHAVFLLLAASVLGASALAWDAAGHRAVTWLALDSLAPSLPAWIKENDQLRQIGWDAAEPDRWRGTRSAYLENVNNPDHYIDLEDLPQFGLSIETLPRLRYRYLAALAIAEHEHPGGVDGTKKPYNSAFDPSGQQEWPGFLPYALMEHYAKLSSSFKTYRTLEKLGDPARATQIEMAKANIRSEMGQLSHFVGDAAQPLHTTRHHHGWVTNAGEPWKDNPDGFTTDRGIHSLIDGGIIRLNTIDYHSLAKEAKREITVNASDPWEDVIRFIARSHDKVRTLYELEKSGELRREPGRALMIERLGDASAMLAALYNAAWSISEPTTREVEDFAKYDAFDPAQQP